MKTLHRIAQPGKPLDLRTEAYTRSSLVHKKSIPANESVWIDAYGDRFYLLKCTAPIEVKTDSTAFKPYRKGTGEQFPEELRFKRIEVRNSNDFAVSIDIWAGFGEYLDQRFEVIDNYSEIVGWAPASLAGGASVTFSGDPTGDQIQRKQIVVGNIDPNSRIDVLDENDNLVCPVFPETSITLPVSGPVKVLNDTGATIAVYISEIWYLENGN